MHLAYWNLYFLDDSCSAASMEATPTVRNTSIWNPAPQLVLKGATSVMILAGLQLFFLMAWAIRTALRRTGSLSNKSASLSKWPAAHGFDSSMIREPYVIRDSLLDLQL